ncbi:MAG: holo-ACP synthase [Candidatus Acidiferrales bacterium]
MGWLDDRATVLWAICYASVSFERHAREETHRYQRRHAPAPCIIALRRWKRLRRAEIGTTAAMIVGMGVDLTEVSRLRAAIERRGQALLRRVYTEQEIAYCERHRNYVERYAGRFAAKEAAMKALGTGWSHGVRWIDIEVTRMPSGKPTLALHGATLGIAERLGVKNISVSITHTGDWAFAQVIFEN